MRIDAQTQHFQAVFEIVVPDRLVPFEEVLAAPDVVDENVEPRLFMADALDEPLDRGCVEMIDLDRDAFAAVTSSAVSSIVSGR
jgi:hypothetical protein